jgi:hypothetical protein
VSEDLFSWADNTTGAALRDAGMTTAAQAQERVAPGWAERAYQAIIAVARQRASVHVDDVLQVFREPPQHPNAWGAVWQKAIREGVITRSGIVRETRDRRKHRHQYPVYLSALYGPRDGLATR